jgi:hypothetical protein
MPAFDFLHDPNVPTPVELSDDQPEPVAGDDTTREEEGAPDAAHAAVPVVKPDSDAFEPDGDEPKKPDDAAPAVKKEGEGDQVVTEPKAKVEEEAGEKKDEPGPDDEIRIEESDDTPLSVRAANKLVRTNFKGLREQVMKVGSVEVLLDQSRTLAAYGDATLTPNDRAEALRAYDETTFNEVYGALIDANLDAIVTQRFGDGITPEDLAAFKESRANAVTLTPSGEGDEFTTGNSELDRELNYTAPIVRDALVSALKAQAAAPAAKPAGEGEQSTAAATAEDAEVTRLTSEFIGECNTVVSDTLRNLNLIDAPGDDEDTLYEKFIMRAAVTAAIDASYFRDPDAQELVNKTKAELDKKNIEGARKKYKEPITVSLGNHVTRVMDTVITPKFLNPKRQAVEQTVKTKTQSKREVTSEQTGEQTAVTLAPAGKPTRAFDLTAMKAKLAGMND